MKKLGILLTLTISLMTATGYAQGGWNYVSSTGTTFILYGMSFPPGQNTIGYACGMQYTYNADGVIIKTTDDEAKFKLNHNQRLNIKNIEDFLQI